MFRVALDFRGKLGKGQASKLLVQSASVDLEGSCEVLTKTTSSSVQPSSLGIDHTR